MAPKKALMVLTILLTNQIIGGIDLAHLMNLGTVPTAIRSLVYYTYPKPYYLTVDLLPSISGIDGNCDYPSFHNYNKTLQNIIRPLAENIKKLTAPVVRTGIQSRFAGIIIGTIALGVATAAQITAAIALSKAQQNARSIMYLKKSVQETNAAVQDLANANRLIVKMVSTIQGQINNIIQPALNNMSCQIKDLQLASALNLYLTELTTVFHNQLTNPALEPLSIQALKSLLGSTLPAVLNSFNVEYITVSEMMASGLITGQVIAVDIEKLTLILLIQIPIISPIRAAKVIDLTSITIHSNNQEVQVVLPKRILEIGSEILGYDGSICQVTKEMMFCPYNDAYVIPLHQKMCMTGKTEECVLTPVTGTFPRRFLSTTGSIVANCRDLVCSCKKPAKIIYQPDERPITIIDKSECSTLMLDTITIEIQNTLNSSFHRAISLSGNQIKMLTPLDLSAEIAQHNDLIVSAENHIKKSENFLAMINPIIVNNTVIIILIIAACLIIGSLIMLFFWVKYLTLEVKRLNTDMHFIDNNIQMQNFPDRLPVLLR
ncbi:fusion protein [Wufeng Rhinolophus sinicus rubulavirus 1]|uniref:Fusion glycoprotein F0 n=1 Tax=Wufeng Rhinolophus sinicus rubulavirus 1 TaxID=2877512 RepID=A0AAE8XRX1_9MONO|nr:fusion protein [Wufeng Rhinolophus sinicus rubulavirus 1]